MSTPRLQRISAGGQISVPAAVRRRWGAATVVLEDHGDRLVIRPQPDDPIAAARGALRGRVPSVGDLRSLARDEQTDGESRRR